MIHQSNPFSKYQEFKTEYSLSHELPYWDFLEQEHIAVLSEGTLIRGFRLQGISVEAFDEEQTNQLTIQLRGMLNALPDGVEIQFVVDSNSDYSQVVNEHESFKGTHPLVSWISDARIERLRGELTDSALRKQTLYLFVYHRAKNKKEGKLSFFSTPKKFVSIRKSEHELRVSELNQIADSVHFNMGAIGIEAFVLEATELKTLVYQVLNPMRSKNSAAPILSSTHRSQEFYPEELTREPRLSEPTPREQLAVSDLIQGVESFFLDGFYHRVVTLKTLPETTYSAMVSKLMNGLPFHYWLSVQIVVPEQSKELSSLQAKRRMAHSMSMTQGGRASNLESEAKLQSTEELLRELLTTGQKIFYFQFAILLRSTSLDELERMTKIALSKFRELNGAEACTETVAGMKVFKTLLPAGNTTSVRSKRVKTDNLADFLPVYQPWERVGKAVCLFRNRLGGLLSYDPFDPALPNFNALVTGSSGAGKSFLNNCILLQYLRQNPLIYIIDIGGSYRKLCDFMKGSYVESGLEADAKSPLKINPFLIPDHTESPSPRKLKFLLALLEVIFTDEEGAKLPKLDKALLEEAILNTYSRLRHQKTPQMSDFKETLEQSSEPALRGYAKMLFPWTGDRPFGQLLDTDKKVELSSEFVVFDLKGVSSYPDLQAVMILILTDFILQKIDENPNRKKRIILDECWEFLKTKSSRSFMEYCVRTLRKTGSGITFITQGLDEIEKSDIGPAILGNTATKLILAQRGGLESVSKTLKLNDQEIGLIRGLRKEKGVFAEAFLMADERRGVIQITPTPLEYWIATSDSADNAFLSEAKSLFLEKTLPEIIHWLATNYPLGSGKFLHLPEFEQKEAA